MTNSEQKPVSITMPENWFNKLNRNIRRVHGSDLYALAESSPETAYSLLGPGILDVLLPGRPIVEGATGITLDARQDGPEATRKFAETEFSNLTPPIDFEPRDVVISVIKQPGLLGKLRHELPRTEVALQFTVQPIPYDQY